MSIELSVIVVESLFSCKSNQPKHCSALNVFWVLIIIIIYACVVFQLKLGT